eukprot:scaffold114530_cov84-Phaeocystis_antarctica.AAC.1
MSRRGGSASCSLHSARVRARLAARPRACAARRGIGRVCPCGAPKAEGKSPTPHSAPRSKAVS